MEDRNFFHTLMAKLLGKQFILIRTDTVQIMAKKQQLQKNPGYAQIYTKISQSLTNHLISGGALAIALSLSLQRYFPSHFSTFGLNKVLADLGLITVCLATASGYAINRNSNELGKIKKQLILNYDKQFLNHMAQLQIKYDIDQEDQVRGVLTSEEYKQWLEKRHEHIF